MRLTVHTSIDTSKMGAIVNGYQKVIRRAVYETGLRVERLAKQNITESSLVDTGRLRASLHVQREGDKFFYKAERLPRDPDPGIEAAWTGEGTIQTRVGPDEVVVGTNVEYAHIHEFGGVVPITPRSRKYFWRRYYLSKRVLKRTKSDDKRTMASASMSRWKALALTKKKSIKVRARPYLTPAYNQVRSEGYLQKRIDRAVRELTK